MTDELEDIDYTPPVPITFTNEQKILLQRLTQASNKLDMSLFTSGFVVKEDGASRNDLRTTAIGFGIRSIRDSLNGAIEGYNPDDETQTLPFDAIDLVSLHSYIQGVIKSLKGSEGVITALSVDFLEVEQGRVHRHQLLNKNYLFIDFAERVLTMIEDHPQFDLELAKEMHYQPVDRSTRRSGGRGQSL